MKKILFLIVLTSAFISCKAQQHSTNKMMDAKTNTPMLVGISTKKDLLEKPFSEWFTPAYNNYKPNNETINELKQQLEGVTVSVFMGTWCEDSQHQVPAFYQILAQLKTEENTISLIMLDRTKTTPDHLEKDKNITNVPTFIFYKNGKEIHRIVETPIESLEKDMLKIVSGQTYKHAYEN